MKRNLFILLVVGTLIQIGCTRSSDDATTGGREPASSNASVTSTDRTADQATTGVTTDTTTGTTMGTTTTAPTDTTTSGTTTVPDTGTTTGASNMPGTTSGSSNIPGTDMSGSATGSSMGNTDVSSRCERNADGTLKYPENAQFCTDQDMNR